MEQDQLEKIKHLISLFKKRDRLYQLLTEKMFEAIGPTALEALFTLFNVPYENVAWLETQLVDNVILLVASITYGDDQTVPAIIQALSPTTGGGQASIRLFRIGLPLELLFQPKEEIVKYLTETTGMVANQRKTQQEDNSMPISPSQPEFDTSQLTHEQIQQLLIFSNETKGIKH